MLGTCMYCNNERIVEDAEVKDFADHNGISVEMAADAVAARQCNCSGATFFRNREEKIKMATDYMEHYFEKDQKVLELAKVAIDTVASELVEKVTFKKGKRTFTLSLDARGCLKFKKDFKETDEEKF